MVFPINNSPKHQFLKSWTDWNPTNECPKIRFNHIYTYLFCEGEGVVFKQLAFFSQGRMYLIIWFAYCSGKPGCRLNYCSSGLGFYLIILDKLNPNNIVNLHAWIFNFKKCVYPSLFPLSLSYPTSLQQTSRRL